MNVPSAPEYLWVGNRRVAMVGTRGRLGYREIIACSVEGGFAVVRDSGLLPNSVRTYRLSDGRQLWRTGLSGWEVASPDGRLLALSLPGPVLGIFSMPTGKRLGTVPVPGSPIGFSGDGSMIGVTLPSSPRFQSFVIEWAAGTTVWTHVDGVDVLRSQPRGSGMIIMTPEISVGPHEVWLIRRSGAPIELTV
jgi:hypothetical protein